MSIQNRLSHLIVEVILVAPEFALFLYFTFPIGPGFAL